MTQIQHALRAAGQQHQPPTNDVARCFAIDFACMPPHFSMRTVLAKGRFWLSNVVWCGVTVASGSPQCCRPHRVVHHGATRHTCLYCAFPNSHIVTYIDYCDGGSIRSERDSMMEEVAFTGPSTSLGRPEPGVRPRWSLARTVYHAQAAGSGTPGDDRRRRRRCCYLRPCTTTDAPLPRRRGARSSAGRQSPA